MPLAGLLAGSGVAAVLCLVLAVPALAHGGNARLVLGSETAPAGSRLEVRVVELWPGEPVEIVLVGPGGLERSLGRATGDAVGSFTTAVDVPADAVPGLYLVTVYAPDGHPLQQPLTIAEPVEGTAPSPAGPFGGAGGLLPAALILAAFGGALLVISVGRRRYR